jgi:hypothetical protein
MPQANWVIVLHFLVLWGTVATGFMAGWRLPISFVVAVPLGLLLWAAGFLYNLNYARQFKHALPQHRAALARRGYWRIAARTTMNVGIGLGFRSWLTLVAAGLLIPFYAAAARRRRLYLDYMRTGMLSNAFPDRVPRR